ncbi:MAG TPA: acetylxylan esterase [Sedimentisphaerales bacterium]|nr:acetylxylan esterase [Sedimentisphaerales bacterium]
MSCVRASGETDFRSILATIPPMPSGRPALCPGRFLTPEQGKAMLDNRLAECPTMEAWETYASHIRKCIIIGADLEPMPRPLPLKLISRNMRRHNDYTVENVAFEVVPGYYVTGNLYRPYGRNGPFAVVLMAMGHFPAGRFEPGNQTACAMLAKMGAIVLTVDMFGVGESAMMTGPDAHRTPLALTMQTLGNIRALDMLLSFADADPNRAGVTGASGGGAQTMLLTALDKRVKVSVPVAMTSSYFFGGCECESGKPIHRSREHFTNNAEIAAMAAPRPMLVVSDGKDWTQHTPTIEYLFLQKIYSLCGAAGNVANVHLPAEGHDYGPSKRLAMYRFMAKHLNLDISAAQDADGNLDERKMVVETEAAMRVFASQSDLPAGACRDAAQVENRLKGLQNR